MTDSQLRQLRPDDFVCAFGEQPTSYVSARIDSYNFEYRALGHSERDFYVRKSVDALCNSDLARAGEGRIGQWELGWGSHIGRLGQPFDAAVLVPGYFGKYPVVRWQQEFIAPYDPRFEYRSFAVIQDWLFDKYFRNASSVYEFGCGTGHNLLRVRGVNPHAALWGLDWAKASQSLISQLRELGVDTNINCHRFNFFEPDNAFTLASGAAVFTAAALEQVGDRYASFVQYLIRNKVNLCIHIEPISELLDENNLLDFLSISYFKRRNYLSGFLNYLRALESDGTIKIHMAQRTSIGSLFIDGYSVIVWSPIG